MRVHRQVSSLVLAVVVFGLIGGATARGSDFTFSATGELHGRQLNTHEFKGSTGTVVRCTTATTSGKKESLTTSLQHLTVQYSGCSAVLSGFTFLTTHVSSATYSFTATGGEMHITNVITIEITAAACKIVIGEQSRKGVLYTNNFSKLIIESNIAGIAYNTTGGLCGPAGTATYIGDTELERVGGGTIFWDA